MNPETTKYLRLINDMLTDSTFDKAADYLQSVKNYIQENNRITKEQRKAVNNIYIKFSENIR